MNVTLLALKYYIGYVVNRSFHYPDVSFVRGIHPLEVRGYEESYFA